MLKGFLEVTHKPYIPIRDYGPRKDIQFDNFIKIKFNNSRSICGMSTMDKVTHLRKTFQEYKYVMVRESPSIKSILVSC